ncbi:ABC transporter ATP-binding protein, partial [Streptomyces violascens]
PYKSALLCAVPLPDPSAERARARIVLPGEPPGAGERSTGCRFRGRCAVYAALGEERRLCERETPATTGAGPLGEHTSACHFPYDAKGVPARHCPEPEEHPPVR